MAVIWKDSAGKHGIPHDETMYAIRHATLEVNPYGDGRDGANAPTLWIGPSRYGILEVIGEVQPPGDLVIFHSMQLREIIAREVGYQRD